MTSLSALVENKSQFVSKHSITFIDQNIELIGISQLYQNIFCLHLSRNQLRSLRGLEQFTQLRYLSVSHNLLTSCQVFDSVTQDLQNLSVQANPLCLNPDYEAQLIDKFDDLIQLDQLKLNQKRKSLAMEVKVKLESYLILLLTFFRLSDKLQGECVKIFLEIKSLLQNTVQKTMLKVFQGVINLFTNLLTNNEQDLNIIFLEFQDPNYQQQQAMEVYIQIKNIMYQDFKENSLNEYYTAIALQTCDIFRFSSDTDYMLSQIVQCYLQSCQQKENLTQIPIFVFNQKYLLAIFRMLQVYVGKNDPISLYKEKIEQTEQLIETQTAQIQSQDQNQFTIYHKNKNVTTQDQQQQLNEKDLIQLQPKMVKFDPYVKQMNPIVEQFKPNEEKFDQKLEQFSPNEYTNTHDNSIGEEVVQSDPIKNKNSIKIQVIQDDLIERTMNQYLLQQISRAKQEYKFDRAFLNLKRVAFSIINRSSKQFQNFKQGQRQNLLNKGAQIMINILSTKQMLIKKSTFIIFKIIKMTQVLKESFRIHTRLHRNQIFFDLKSFVKHQNASALRHYRWVAQKKVLKIIIRQWNTKQNILKFSKLTKKVMKIKRQTLQQLWIFSNQCQMNKVRESYSRINQKIAVRDKSFTKSQRNPSPDNIFLYNLQFQQLGKKNCSVCSYIIE